MAKIQMNKRIWELDFLRGIALVLMVYFHIIYDANNMFNYPVNEGSIINHFIGNAAGTLFIFISGISCIFSRHNFKRGLKIFGVGMLLTIITNLYGHNTQIWFGILHFLGISIMLFAVLDKLNNIILMFIGTFLIIAGNIIYNMTFSFGYLFFLGFTGRGFYSSDFYPLTPWLGVFIFGMVAGRVLYGKEKKSLFKVQPRNNILNIAGRHTLLIYLAHQPVIIAIFTLIENFK